MSEEVTQKIANSQSIKLEPGEVVHPSRSPKSKTSGIAKISDVQMQDEIRTDMDNSIEEPTTDAPAKSKRFPRILAELNQLQAELEREVNRLETAMSAAEDELAQVREARSVLAK